MTVHLALVLLLVVTVFVMPVQVVAVAVEVGGEVGAIVAIFGIPPLPFLAASTTLPGAYGP